MQTSPKPRRDPVTGCAHIINQKNMFGKNQRACSYCYAVQPEEVVESWIKFCWRCGEMFDHSDDDPMEVES